MGNQSGKPAPLRIKALLVEDEYDLAELLVLTLNDIVAEVDWVTSVELAESKLSRGGYDLILADFRLEGKQSGLDLWSKVHRDHPDTPFILVSGYSANVFNDLLETGMDCPPFLSKPFTRDSVRACIVEVMGKAGRAETASVSSPAK